VTVTRECDFGDFTFKVGTFTWFVVPGAEGYTLSDAGSTIAGTRSETDRDWEWHFALEAPSE
jgi:hypothetical protein